MLKAHGAKTQPACNSVTDIVVLGSTAREPGYAESKKATSHQEEQGKTLTGDRKKPLETMSFKAFCTAAGLRDDMIDAAVTVSSNGCEAHARVDAPPLHEPHNLTPRPTPGLSSPCPAGALRFADAG